jgi:hypothetical protein
MRETEPKFQLFDIAHVRAGDWIIGHVAGTGIARLGETRGTAREYKNSGNKAKKWLKTKDITFLNAANFGLFVCKSAPIRHQKEQEHPISHERSEASEEKCKAVTATRGRLQDRLVIPSFRCHQ